VSASGYIEERLKTLRCKLTPTKKAHKKHVFRRLITDNDDVDDMETGDMPTCHVHKKFVVSI